MEDEETVLGGCKKVSDVYVRLLYVRILNILFII